VEILFCLPPAGKKDWSDSPVRPEGDDASKSLRIQQKHTADSAAFIRFFSIERFFLPIIRV
jgi:hypothetical protein